MNRNRSGYTQVRGLWLYILRAAWLILAVLIIGLWIAGTLVLIADSYPDCSEVPCDNIDITIGDLEAADDIGISPGLNEAAAWILGSLAILISIFYFIIAGIISWRMSDDWLGMLVSITLVFLGGLFFTSSNDALLRAFPDLINLHDLILLSGTIAIIALFLLFPNGRFVPRWAGWAAGGMLSLFLVSRSLSALDVVSDSVDLLLTLVIVIFAAANQIYRYFRVSSAASRQQTKWVVLGLFSALILMITWSMVGFFYPPDQPGPSRLVALLIAVPLIFLLNLLFPLTLAISILRYRLWDIDIIINRGLIYGALTLILALIYFGTVTILQNLFTAVTGQQSPVALVISTLIIAALFQPLYRRVQELINRRFFRGKYDAGKILAEFASTARDEVDLDNITAALLDAAEKTLQPAVISLWLKEPSRHSVESVEKLDLE